MYSSAIYRILLTLSYPSWDLYCYVHLYTDDAILNSSAPTGKQCLRYRLILALQQILVKSICSFPPRTLTSQRHIYLPWTTYLNWTCLTIQVSRYLIWLDYDFSFRSHIANLLKNTQTKSWDSFVELSPASLWITEKNPDRMFSFQSRTKTGDLTNHELADKCSSWTRRVFSGLEQKKSESRITITVSWNKIKFCDTLLFCRYS